MTQHNSILFVTMNSIAGQGGDSMATKEILSTFVDDDRVSTAAVVPDPQGSLPLDLDESRIYCFEPLSKNSTTAYLRYAFSPIKSVRRALQEYEPDVVVIRMYPLGIIPPLLSVLSSTPYILLSRGTSYKSLRYARVLRQLYKVNARLAAEVYSASYEIKQDTDRARTKSQPESKLVPNGINPDEFEPKSRSQMRDMLDLDFDDDDFVVGFVGSMGPRHTLDTLIRSLDKIDDLPVKLLLVGDGPELDSHKRLVKENNLSGRVTFTGFVPHAEVDKYISACDITYGVTQQDSATPIKCFEYLGYRPTQQDSLPVESAASYRPAVIVNSTVAAFAPEDPSPESSISVSVSIASVSVPIESVPVSVAVSSGGSSVGVGVGGAARAILELSKVRW